METTVVTLELGAPHLTEGRRVKPFSSPVHLCILNTSTVFSVFSFSQVKQTERNAGKKFMWILVVHRWPLLVNQVS